MPGALRISVNGFDNVEKMFLSLADDYGHRKARTALRPPMKKAMAPVLRDVINFSPRDTGELIASIRGVGRPPSKFVLAQNKNIVYVYSVGYFWRRGATRSQYRKAIALEYGTRYQRELATLRGALDRNVGKVLSTLGNDIKSSITKRATVLGKRG